MSHEQRLEDLGLVLPPALEPLAAHARLVCVGELAFVSGHGPTDSQRVPVFTGAIGAELTEGEGYEAARLAALNTLATLRAEFGSLDRVQQVVKLTGFVLSAPGFSRQPWVVDGASHLFNEVFGPVAGSHARTSVAVSDSGLRMAVTIESVFKVAS